MDCHCSYFYFILLTKSIYFNVRLCDGSVLVRYNTLMVLTHLILNDMVKVKGHVSQVVLCLSDPDDKMRDLATVFFVKLAERSNNPVYNLLGDIIGALSSQQKQKSVAEDSEIDVPSTNNDDDEMEIEGVTQSQPQSSAVLVQATQSVTHSRVLTTKEFQSTMQFLLSFVKKDK